MANYGRRYNQYQTYDDDSGDDNDQSTGYGPQANVAGYGYTPPNPYYASPQPGYGYAPPNPYYAPPTPNPYHAPSQPGYGYAPRNPYNAAPPPRFHDTGVNAPINPYNAAPPPRFHDTGVTHQGATWQDDGTPSTGSVSADEDGGGGGDFPVEVEEWNDGRQIAGFNRTFVKPRASPGQQSRPSPQPRGNPGPRTRVNTGPPISKVGKSGPARRR
ncbi:pollen-specific leucine-rich repeat extensin-like protein 2 [Euphorbia lathyris]|uniref:pollen-specific leucine-rich repeat extensin-like protein 2 n=1 Tax=Euphorbia lathyris TaxID=212925 RepID=UPI003313D5A9